MIFLRNGVNIVEPYSRVMDNYYVLSATLITTKSLGEQVRSSASNCSIAPKPLKLWNGPKAVIYVGHIFSTERVY